MTCEEKLKAIRSTLEQLGNPDFWTMEMLETALDQIDHIIDPE